MYFYLLILLFDSIILFCFGIVYGREKNVCFSGYFGRESLMVVYRKILEYEFFVVWCRVFKFGDL